MLLPRRPARLVPEVRPRRIHRDPLRRPGPTGLSPRRKRPGQTGGVLHRDKYWQRARKRGTPMWRIPLRRARTNSSRAARNDPKRSAAPGSLTGENARMLEIERQNNESDGGQSNIAAGSGDTAGSQGPPQAGSGQPEEAGAEARSPRRRRSVTRPPGPPSPEVIEPAAPASAGSPAGTA